MLGSAFLRLEQVDVTAPGDVEGMSASADHSAIIAQQGEMAIADGAE